MSIRALLVVPPVNAGSNKEFARLEAGKSIEVGRSKGNDLVLADPVVSGRHARISLDRDNRLLALDLDSRNGTWIVKEEGEERIGTGPAAVDEGSSIRVGPFHLVPCEMLGDDIAIGGDPSFEVTVDGSRKASSRSDHGVDAQASEPVLRAISRAMSTDDSADAWTRVLNGLVDLACADSAALITRVNGRFLLRASKGKAILSQKFLEAVSSHSGAWRVTPGESPADWPGSVSMSGYGPQTTLTGLPFRSLQGEIVAIAHLEHFSGPSPVPLGALDLYATICGPLLEIHLELDQAMRRSEALAARLGKSRGTQESRPAPEDDRVLVGRNPRFLRAIEAVRRAAPSSTTILIRGPSGSGKEELAALAHELSKRNNQPFLAMNCASLPETLVESELFGADKGAFTGADKERPGAFAQADGGTIFLDEIGDLPLSAQAKILRVIETGEVVRVGGSRRRVDVRLVAATHRDLESMVRDSLFREDLYYRLRVLEVMLPTLAERADDIAALSEHFLKQFRRPDGRTVAAISVRAARALSKYVWPGNIRELRNVIERAVVLDGDGVLDVDDLPAEVAVAGGPVADLAGSDDLACLLDRTWREAKERFEEHYFRTALARNDGQVKKTAKETGVDRRTLSDKIRRYRLRDDDPN